MYQLQLDGILQAARIRGKLASYRAKLEKSIQLCEDALASHKAPYVALSGGKDSVAMAYIVDEAARRCGRDFTLWLHASDASFPGTVETCQRVADQTGRRLDVSMCRTSAFDMLSMDRVRAFGKQGIFFDEVRRYAQDKDLAFVGTRAAESKRRRSAAKAHGDSFYSRSMGDVDVVCPMQWFDLVDVFAAILHYNAPIHPIYYKIPVNTKDANANGEPQFIRLSYVTSRDLWDAGTLYFIKVNYPDLYARVIEHLPDASIYT